MAAILWQSASYVVDARVVSKGCLRFVFGSVNCLEILCAEIYMIILVNLHFSTCYYCPLNFCFYFAHHIFSLCLSLPRFDFCFKPFPPLPAISTLCTESAFKQQIFSRAPGNERTRKSKIETGLISNAQI